MKPGELLELWDYGVQKRVLNAIDRYEWKHSWHLPSDGYGIDWFNPATAEKCVDVLKRYGDDARRFSIECETLCGVLQRHLEQRRREEQ